MVSSWDLVSLGVMVRWRVFMIKEEDGSEKRKEGRVTKGKMDKEDRSAGFTGRA